MLKSIPNILKFGAVAFALQLTVGHAAFAQETILRMLHAWDETIPGTQTVAFAFGEKVKTATNGRIAINYSGPEVVPPGQQFQPTSSGVFDINHSTAPYMSGTTGVPYGLLALDPDAEMWREKGYWDFVDQEFMRFGQKLLAYIAESNDADAFHIVLKEPLGAGDRPLEGRKIRGNTFYAPMIEPLGASLVNLAGGEIYQALDRGVVDGAGWSVEGTHQLKLQEVAKYRMLPRFGVLATYLTMNFDAFNSLPPEDQEILLQAGRELEHEVPAKAKERVAEAIAAMSDGGMEETVLDQALADELLAGFKAGMWDIARNSNEQTRARVEEFYEMAKENGDAE